MKNSRIKNKAYLTGSDFVKYYRRQVRALVRESDSSITGTNLLVNAVSAIFDEIAKSLTENVAGVHMFNLGYFSVWRSYNRLPVGNYPTSTILNTHSDGYQYFLDFFPETTNNRALYGWAMDRRFNKRVKRKLSQNLKRGYQYKNFYEIFLSNRKNGITV